MGGQDIVTIAESGDLFGNGYGSVLIGDYKGDGVYLFAGGWRPVEGR